MLGGFLGKLSLPSDRSRLCAEQLSKVVVCASRRAMVRTFLFFFPLFKNSFHHTKLKSSEEHVRAQYAVRNMSERKMHVAVGPRLGTAALEKVGTAGLDSARADCRVRGIDSNSAESTSRDCANCGRAGIPAGHLPHLPRAFSDFAVVPSAYFLTQHVYSLVYFCVALFVP